MNGAVIEAGTTPMLLFRIARELFALPLTCAEEALESLERESLPGMPGGMLGIARHRGEPLPVYAATAVLGVAVSEAEPVTLVVRAPTGGRIGLLVDDVEDVIMTDLRALRAVPGPASADPVLRGVLPREGALIAVCDADALVRACTGART